MATLHLRRQEQNDVKVKALNEKVSLDGVIEVTVRLPGSEHHFRFVKPNVLANVAIGRLTRSEFKRVFENGLAPLLGGIVEK